MTRPPPMGSAPARSCKVSFCVPRNRRQARDRVSGGCGIAPAQAINADGRLRSDGTLMAASNSPAYISTRGSSPEVSPAGALLALSSGAGRQGVGPGVSLTMKWLF